MNTSKINLIDNKEVKNKFLSYASVKEDDSKIYIVFEKETHIIAKKVGVGGSKFELENHSLYFQFLDQLFEDENHVDIPSIEAKIRSEVSLYIDEQYKLKEEKFLKLVNDCSKFYEIYLKSSVSSTKTDRWEEYILQPLEEQSRDVLLQVNKEIYLKTLKLKENFTNLEFQIIKAKDYFTYLLKIAEQLKINNPKLNKNIDLFIENLTFEQCLLLPEPNPKKIVLGLFDRIDYDNEEASYMVKEFANVNEMIKSFS